MNSYFFGFYDFVLGFYSRLNNAHTVAAIDKINAKNYPEKIVGDSINKVFTLSSFIERVVVKIEGMKNVDYYNHEASCTHRLHDVKIPLFFLNANDDPIMGNKIIPVDKCY